jgi:hypothetical protein
MLVFFIFLFSISFEISSFSLAHLPYLFFLSSVVAPLFLFSAWPCHRICFLAPPCAADATRGASMAARLALRLPHPTSVRAKSLVQA